MAGPKPEPLRRPAWLLAPGVCWLAALFVAPLALVVAMSFARRGAPVEWVFDPTAWGRALDPVLVSIVTRSLGLGLWATAVCAVVGFPLTYFIVRRPPRLRSMLYFLVLIPLTANSLVLVYSWIVLLRPTGLVEQALRGLGLVDEGIFSILYTPVAVLIGLTYWYLPFMVYPLYASMERFDFRLFDAAADLGAGRVRILVRVLLPQALPGLATGCLLVFVQAFCSFVVPDLLGGAKTMMVGNFIQQRFLNLPQDWPLGAAVALVMMAFLGGVIWLANRSGPREV